MTLFMKSGISCHDVLYRQHPKYNKEMKGKHIGKCHWVV